MSRDLISGPQQGMNRCWVLCLADKSQRRFSVAQDGTESLINLRIDNSTFGFQGLLEIDCDVLPADSCLSLLTWWPFLFHRALLGTLTMPWGPSSITTLYGSNLGGCQNSTTFLRDTQWRSGKAIHFVRVSHVFGSWPTCRLWVFTPWPFTGAPQATFLSSLVVFLLGMGTEFW